MEWSLFARDVERTAVPARGARVAFVPHSPLGRGFLTGSFAAASELTDGDFRRYMPRFTGDNAVSLAPVHAGAEARGLTAAQIAPVWVHSRAQVDGLSVVPVPDTRRPTRLAENVVAAGAVRPLRWVRLRTRRRSTPTGPRRGRRSDP